MVCRGMWVGGLVWDVLPGVPQGWWRGEVRRPPIFVVLWDEWVLVVLVGGSV